VTYTEIGAFLLRSEAAGLSYSMSLPSIGLACVISSMVLGCATEPPVSASEEARLWRKEKESQQQGVREEGRIGYIGNEGSAGE
jgi:hypothetical protein